jgi:Radical SAM superfamily
MKLALVAPAGPYLPLHPSALIGYGAAVLAEHGEVDVIDFCMRAHAASKWRVAVALDQLDRAADQSLISIVWEMMRMQARAQYQKVPWADYDAVFVTQPAWAPTVDAALVLDLAGAIRAVAPGIDIRYYGMSLGTWTNPGALERGGVRPVHLGDPFGDSSWQRPTDYDALPTPVYSHSGEYLFPMLPFHMRHGCCWGKCKFCSISRGAGAGYLERSVDRVAAELGEIVATYDPAALICRDNAVNGGNIVALCERIRDFGKPWLCYARTDLTRDEVDALALAGCKAVYLGVESGSDRVLEAMNKGVTAADHDRVMAELADAGIEPIPSIFVGAPWETDDDFEKTCDLVRRQSGRARLVNVYQFRWSPGAPGAAEGKLPHPNAAERYHTLIDVCREAGMKAVPGITTLEFMAAKIVCSMRHGYDQSAISDPDARLSVEGGVVASPKRAMPERDD